MILTKAISDNNGRNRIVRGPGFELGHSLSPSTLINHYDENKLSAGYAPITTIATHFQKILPYAINSNGKPLDNVVGVDALYRPNQEMDAVRFRAALAVTTLVLNEVRILVWRKDGKQAKPGGKITADKIAGYTFLEDSTLIKRNGEWVYQIVDDSGQMAYFTKNEVITLKNGVNPFNVSNGYSPTEASRKWSRIDDYIADYQAGFFENGAIPAGQFVIQAPTGKEYEDIVEKMKDKHRGANKNNNVTYTYDPIDPTTGKNQGASIQWIPFNQTNKNLDLKSIFEQVNSKLESAYRVPAFLQGIDDAPNFATAQISYRNFVENNIEPFAIAIWSQFTHELNRITGGGLGYAITFDLEIPAIAEEDKMVAETRQVEVNTISALTAAGYSLNSVVDALKLSNAYKLLKISKEPAVIDNTKPQVAVDADIEMTPDPNNTTKKEVSERTNPKVTGISKSNLKLLSTHKTITDTERLYFQARIEDVTRKYMHLQIDGAISQTKAVGDATETMTVAMTAEMLAVIAAYQEVQGQAQLEAGVQLMLEAGFDNPNIAEFKLTPAQLESYELYLKEILTSYNADTSNSIRKVLTNANELGLNNAQLKKNLRGIMNTDEFRVKRLAISEINRAGSLASVNSMENIQADSDILLEKTMLSSTGKPCVYCATRIGVWYGVSDEMVAKGTTITGTDGTTFQNNWDDNYGHDIHANGKCVPVYRVKAGQKSIKKTKAIEQDIHCTKCKRYLGKATGNVNAVIKCSGSKCKHDNVVEL